MTWAQFFAYEEKRLIVALVVIGVALVFLFIVWLSGWLK